MMSSLSSFYMDSCCFIDMAKKAIQVPMDADREPHIFFCRKFIEAARAKHLAIYTSTITAVECVKLTDDTKPGGPTREDDSIKELFKKMLMSGRSGVMPVMPTPVITELARDLRWNHGITCKPIDRLHLATALAMNCSHFFTTDDKLGQQNVSKLGTLGLAICRSNAAVELLPDQYKQLPLEGSKLAKTKSAASQAGAGSAA
ncbi:type II toxin-antitoxin system VapC family toxin [Methylibium sp.]|uniref:type II toxin-antitoxin system VapC family toxin n=1 Tax=Methylibium sp. TaxID=2067992 RepID=UPI003BAD18DC